MAQKPLVGHFVIDGNAVAVYIINNRVLHRIHLLRQNAAAVVFDDLMSAGPEESGIGTALALGHGVLGLVAVTGTVRGGKDGDLLKIFAADPV